MENTNLFNTLRNHLQAKVDTEDDIRHLFPCDSTASDRKKEALSEEQEQEGFRYWTVYKAWLCSQYFEATQFHCSSRIPCKQYCSEVQTRCPFVLPDNKDLVYGGLPSFLCADVPNNHPTNAEPECCDVRWEIHNAASNKQSKGGRGATKPVLCHRSSLTTSAASRLCNTRLKLCVLVLILLHTVVTVSASQTSAGLSSGGLPAWDDNATNDE
ncbi:NALCN channel auxiliary factor 1-like [Leucoraja erinacea]|uniref:NALCN channel auxiliary factor 1-like n=1 Tax=Leucoraja erinaceus TaxID=7782 RepID=UPI0024559996|nr:NALCN channel auxiliary factor 1-like [Leucoraja erinacea]